MAVNRGCRNTETGDKVIEKEIQTIMQEYRQNTAPEDLEKNLKESFGKFRESIEDDTVMAVDGWICEFCDEIFTGRSYEEAGVTECERCSNIVCDSCAETCIEERKGRFICKDCW
ncbi:hypothetical protein C4588_01845 [Candidatus Parcubacteria bacterium]|nr:MAG: hypothetical protein C4588_01845 [Candidatus Parcubacteria bacterium]